MWRTLSISVTDLLFFGAEERSAPGPEDETDFVQRYSHLWIGCFVDWVLTSYFKMTKSQAFGAAVNLVSMHSSFTLNLLVFYLRDLFTFIFYGLLSFSCKIWVNSPLICTTND